MSNPIPRLIPDYDQMSVERAIGEMRAGRPVIVIDGDQTGLVIGVEAITREVALRSGPFSSGLARIVLPSARLRRLGVERDTAGSLALPVIDGDRIETLALKVTARADAPVSATSVIDRAGLELASLSAVLPAVIIVPLTDRAMAGEGLLSVRAEAIEQYRKRASARLTLVSRAAVPLEGAKETEFVVFRGGEGLRDQVAIIIGKPDLSKPVSVRLHSACLTGDLFGSLKCDCGDQLRQTVQWMAEHDGGIVLYLDQEGRGNGLSNKILAYRLQSQGHDTYEADEILGFDKDQRHFDFAAEILKQLGVAHVNLFTNNPNKVDALRRAGIEVAGQQRVFGRRTLENSHYLDTKRDRAGHALDHGDKVVRAKIRD